MYKELQIDFKNTNETEIEKRITDNVYSVLVSKEKNWRFYFWNASHIF